MSEEILTSWRKRSRELFDALGFPTPKQERFQYLPLAALQKIWPQQAQKGSVAKESLQLIAPHYLVFVDGDYEPLLSNPPAGLVCLPLSASVKSYGLFIQNRLAKWFKEEKDPFAALNGAHQGDGAFLYVPPHFQCPGQLQIHHVVTKAAAPRIQIALGKQAQLTLIQTTQALCNAPFINGCIDLVLEAGSQAKLLDVPLLPKEAASFCAVRATLKRDSRFELLHATNGAQTVRLSARFELAEENSTALLQCLGMLRDERQAHIEAHVEHAAPNCASRQLVKMALNGKSKSSFEGKIYVHPIAQKTEAYQSNRNLLLSDEASANAKPNLEIFADDVKASHGATFAQLSGEELLYLRSRGIGELEARGLLVEGFCRELIDAVENSSLRAELLQEMKRSLQ